MLRKFASRVSKATTAMVGMVSAGVAQAEVGDIGGVASNVSNSLAGVGQLISAGSYVAGMGFAVGAILKFKAHKDNPQQIPVGTPVALLFIAAALIFMPTIIDIANQTLFQGSGTAGGLGGVLPDTLK